MDENFENSHSCCCSGYIVAVAIIALIWALAKTITCIQDSIQGRKIIAEKIKRKQKERELSFQKLEAQKRYQLTAEHEKILQLPFEELVDSLQSRKLTATQVLESFMAKALKVTREINSVTEFISEAETWAKELDGMSTIKGPLHGVPISVKDNVFISGYDSTIGLGKNLFNPVEDTNAIVRVLMDAGAVPFCKTNIPQTLLSYGCSNPIFGSTKNCLNPELSPGGSSGGESSLVGAGASVIGVGSDIGGSVRIPAHFCGVTGLKATKDRLSGSNFQTSLPSVVGVTGVPGFVATNVTALTCVSRIALKDAAQNQYDPLCFPIPWNEELFSSPKKLRIGYVPSLKFHPLVGDSAAVLENAKKALEARGHVVVPFEMPDSFKMMEMVFDFVFADKGKFLMSNWRHEPIPRAIIPNYLICAVPQWVRTLVAAILKYPGTPVHSRRSPTVFSGGCNTTSRLWARLSDRKKLVAELIKQWKEKDLDLLLTPTYPMAAIPENMTGTLNVSVLYTMIWNLFDFPAGVMKYGTESGKNIDSFETEGDFVLRLAKKVAPKAIGMPISVQFVGLPHKEELVLKGLKELEATLKS